MFPLGLITDLIRLLKTNELEFTFDKSIIPSSYKEEINEFIANEIPLLKLEPYDYQLESFKKSIALNRSLVLSPTRKWKITGYLSNHSFFTKTYQRQNPSFCAIN